MIAKKNSINYGVLRLTTLIIYSLLKSFSVFLLYLPKKIGEPVQQTVRSRTWLTVGLSGGGFSTRDDPP